VAAPLPIDPLLPDIIAALRTGQSLVLEAPPGAGKTTRVPAALLSQGFLDGDILVLEPRRLAARLAARQVARERSEAVGETVGYQVRFEEVAGPRTRLRFVTEGILTRRLLSDPELVGVGAVVLDEFHERHLEGDVALALLRRLQRHKRPELRLVCMSATLDAAPVARFLGDCPRLSAEGRRYDVAIEYATSDDDRPCADRVAASVKRLVKEGLPGHVLCFLPGAADIERAYEALAELARAKDLRLCRLHGSLPAQAQDLAVAPSERPKVILSTNVAETSVTIEDVVAVIDSGLARIAGHAPGSGVPTLRTGKISRASAAQRAGRAGRTQAGRCLRLYTRHDHDTRPPYEVPEVHRADLAQVALELHGAGVADLATFEWFETPAVNAASALHLADALLRRLAALTDKGALTETGRRMLRFPLGPRMSRVLVEAEALGVAGEACGIAALLGERSLLGREARLEQPHGSSDLLSELELYEEGAGDPRTRQVIERTRRQLVRLCDTSRARPTQAEAALLKSILAGFPDRVARRRRAGSPELLLSSGGSAELDRHSVVGAPLVVAVDLEVLRTSTGAARTVVRQASAIQPEWLLDLAADALRDETVVEWNGDARRVEAVSRLYYDQVVLDEKRGPPGADKAALATQVLVEAALARGLGALPWADAFERWSRRLAFARGYDPSLPVCGEAHARAALLELGAGLSTLDQLHAQPLPDYLRGELSPRAAARLAELAPERIALAGGRSLRVEYPADAPPFIASRLQDFFGRKDGPAIAGGRVPLVLHLLAPNHRAVQITTDLSGFWSRHYPSVRRELMRKYPRHAWPEDPTSASPPAPKRK
jgi:ATP-dependent helicase HrpB